MEPKTEKKYRKELNTNIAQKICSGWI